MLFLSVGVLLMTLPGGSTVVRLVGLGLWWVSALLIVDALVGGGFAAQCVWGVGVAFVVGAYLNTDLPQRALEVSGQLVVALLSVGLAVVALIVGRGRGGPR
jgi:hypothetical protein